ncbi:hypothetical protein N476_16500 [Pseudoalteromonas luteoviolacea H33]|uniref:Uncharacterized protein n=1 Tax=Pseudoalteromonas luteoviolacea H33 TaxID=1365251 RepID=A0A167EDS2_9GAMM|nr:hypothetical protein N476_16500 [Pseudoalteromonas luteoviolacea H33]KZN77907.1 hypothetical protein N477_10965 [Pseudoalteromonas luteoviolacea H33-S]
MPKVDDNEHSKYISFTQERCKRLATVNEVSPLFLRMVNIVRKVCDTARIADTLFAQGEYRAKGL